MPKIDLTGRENGDFIVLREIEPIYTSTGKKKFRWVCECKTCHEREVVFGESIRRGRHRFCTSCMRVNDTEYKLEDVIAKINRSAVAAGFRPITDRQLVNTYKFIKGSLAQEDEKDLPEFIDKFVF